MQLFSRRKSPTWCMESQRMGCDPVICTWRPLQSALPQTYTELHAFLGLVSHYRGSLRGLHALPSHLMNSWLGREPAGSQSGYCFQKMPWRPLKHWKVCMTACILAFTDYTKPFLLQTDASKEGLGWCYHRNRQTGNITLSPLAAVPLCLTRRTTTQLSSNP